MDTIFALSTIFGKSGVAVIRVSGTQVLNLLANITDKTIAPGQVIYSKIMHAITKEIIDYGLLIYFAKPHSFTGEDVLELQVHGSMAVIKDVLHMLQSFGLRPAEPGEFSKRAFLNNKLDLVAAEGLADLIEAETSLQRQVALRQLQGNNSNLYEGWRAQIIATLAYLEALIDFPDDDIPIEAMPNAIKLANKLHDEIAAHLQSAATGEILKSAFRIAIVGEPNVGKSSLLNRIANREVAIVSDIPGTTRDALEVRIDLHGYPVSFFDTAGVRESQDTIEQIGVAIARRTAENAQIIMMMQTPHHHAPDIMIPENAIVLYINAKSDIYPQAAGLNISSATGAGITELLNTIHNILQERYSISNAPIITAERYRFHLQKTLGYLNAFQQPHVLEIQVEMLRSAAHEIGRITGKIDVEEILDDLFSKFCIGK